MKLSEYIKNYRKANKMTLQEFADKAGLSKGYISQLEHEYSFSKTGKQMSPSIVKLKQIADAMNIDVNDLLNNVDADISTTDTDLYIAPPSKSTRIPLYSAISCGTGIFVDDNVEDYLYIPDKFLRKGKEYYAVTAHGDSMVGKGIKSGDILVFEKTQILDNGEVGSFCIDENDAVCKVFRKLSTGIVLLESANDKYAPIEIDVSQDTCFRIIGRYKFKFSIEQED